MRLVITADTIGGVWTFSCELARELLACGHRILMVSFGGIPTEVQAAEAAQLATSNLFEYVSGEIPLEWQPENQNAYAFGEPLLLQLCEQFQPDVLLLSQFCFGALPVRLPKIVIAHSDVLGWADALERSPLPEDTWLQTYRVLVQKGLQEANLVIAPTADMLQSIRKNFQFMTPARVISNGRSLPPSPAGSPRQLRAVTAGRMWDPAKNLALLRAADLPLPVVVAGETDIPACETDGVRCTGQLGPDALITLFRESALYICCSRYEPFGLAALEAALCGCAVLVNDIASLREVWEDGALYFHDAASLSSQLQLLVSDGARLIKAQGRSVARAQRYTSAAMAAAYLQAASALLPYITEAAHAA